MTTPTFAFPVRLSEKYRPRKVAEFVGLSKAKRVLAKFAAQSLRVLVSILRAAGSRQDFDGDGYGRGNGRGVPSSGLAEVQPGEP